MEGQITAWLFRDLFCGMPLILLVRLPVMACSLLGRSKCSETSSITRTDDRVFLSRRDGSIIRQGLPSRNWMALIVLGMATVDILGVVAVGVVEGTFT